jgi:FMN phosphatase YigB (HAD superfamily)
MINTIMFDLDGTLLKFSQDAFIGAYFKEIHHVFSGLGLDANLSVKAIWVGTKAMISNDGSTLNANRFWEAFAEFMKLDSDKIKTVEKACEDFYENEFDAVKSIMEPNDISKRLVNEMLSKGYDIVLATNPLFPACAVTTRLGWLGLQPQDFLLVTHYANSTYCKPNPGYYREILQKINKAPEQCIMIGNSIDEDMSVGALGVETFLVTDHLENSSGADIGKFRHGTLAELESYLMSFPDIIK